MFSSVDVALTGVALGLIACDVLLGLVKAFATDTYKSEIMRHGLWHKAAEVLIIIAMYLVGYVPDVEGSQAVVAGLPTGQMACAYIIAMEIGSIIENWKAIYPTKNEGDGNDVNRD